MSPTSLHLATRVEPERAKLFRLWLNHHRPRVDDGLALLHGSPEETRELEALCAEFEMGFVRYEGGFLDGTQLAELSRAAAATWFDGWLVHCDSDEFIAPDADLRESAAECQADGFLWLRGWICDRLAPGGKILLDPDWTRPLDEQFPVKAHITAKILRGAATKCLMAQVPHVSIHHYSNDDRNTKVHPREVRVDHYKWHGPLIERTEARLLDLRARRNPYAAQSSAMIRHYRDHGRFKAEDCLCSASVPIHGWFDFAPLYKRILQELPDGAVAVEVGVWQGKSACYFLEVAQALGKRVTLWLVDRFQGIPGGSRSPTIPESFSGASWLQRPVAWLHRWHLLDQARVLQCDSDRAARLFDDASVDFVFIDAAHDTESVTRDLKAWWPKIKLGGSLCGHDMKFASVRTAVMRFVEALHVEPEHPGPCWQIRKDGPKVISS